MAHLEYRSPSRGLVTAALSAAPLRAGRRNDLELVLDSPFAANLHFVVEPADGGYVVFDQFSAGGTYLNDARLAGPTPLRDGDVLLVGPDLRIVFRA